LELAMATDPVRDTRPIDLEQSVQAADDAAAALSHHYETEPALARKYHNEINSRTGFR